MKVLQINTCLHIGGTGMVAESIGRKVIDEGWESYIAYSRNYISKEPPSESKIIKLGNRVDLYNHVVQNRIFDSQGLCSRLSTKKFISVIDSISPDLIQLHNLHGYYVNYPILFSYLRERGIPVVWTLHDCWPFTGHCTHFEARGCVKWKSGCDKCPAKGDYPSSFLLDRSRRNYEIKKSLFTSLDNLTIVAVSEWLGCLLKESFLNEVPIHVIHNGVDINRFHPQNDNESEIRKRYGLGNRRVILGVASTWTQKKGLDDFIQLAPLLPNDLCIVLLGLSEKQIEILPPNIIGLKRTSNFTDLLGFYSLSSVFCNPTYEDNFPTTNIESLACGTPVITYRTGGSPEAIDENTGLVVTKGDVLGLYDAIMKVLPKRIEYSTSCRSRAVKMWNKDERFDEYIVLYKELLS